MRSPLRPLPAAVARWTVRARLLRWLDALVAWLVVWTAAVVVLPHASPESLAILAALAVILGALARPLRARWRPASRRRRPRPGAPPRPVCGWAPTWRTRSPPRAGHGSPSARNTKSEIGWRRRW